VGVFESKVLRKMFVPMRAKQHNGGENCSTTIFITVGATLLFIIRIIQ
jgi:hypothetical protein